MRVYSSNYHIIMCRDICIYLVYQLINNLNMDMLMTDIEDYAIDNFAYKHSDRYIISDTSVLKNVMSVFVSCYNTLKPLLYTPASWNERKKNTYIQTYILKPLSKVSEMKHAHINKTKLVFIYKKCVEAGLISDNLIFEKYIQAKSTRSDSGIVSITLVLSPGSFSCKYDCYYCPNDTTTIIPKLETQQDKREFQKFGYSIQDIQQFDDEKLEVMYKNRFTFTRGISRSYLAGEPAVDRGIQNGFNCNLQFKTRLDHLSAMGHQVTKFECILSGGTFDSYDKKYREDFIRDLYYSANTYTTPTPRTPLSLEEEITINETSSQAIIGLTCETRPDQISRDIILFYRRLSITRVQLGVQTIFDTLLNNVNRGCKTSSVFRAIQMLKSNGYKIGAHFMPDLPGTTPEVDMLMMRWLCGETITTISDEAKRIISYQGIELLKTKNTMLCVNDWKLYPTMVLPHTRIKQWYESGEYQPYGSIPGKIDELMTYALTHCPDDIRINRLVRDFSSKDVYAGVNRLGMRDELTRAIKTRQTDIRSREVKSDFLDVNDAKLYITEFEASEGTEFFISLENSTKTCIYGFSRLRFNHTNKYVYFDCIKHTKDTRVGMILELHVYGGVIPIHTTNTMTTSQHLGIGKLLMYVSERIAMDLNYNKMAVIAGVGARKYYEKLGYTLEETYMTKLLLGYSVCPDIWVNKLDNMVYVPRTSNTLGKVYNTKMNTVSYIWLYFVVVLVVYLISIGIQ